MNWLKRAKKSIKKERRKILSEWPGWKHFLIPHEGNNYLPHILHPHRIWWHAASAVLMKAVVVVVFVMLPVTAWLTPDILTKESREIIALTNKVRANVTVDPVTENPTLTQAAIAKAEDMLLGQYFAHIGPDGRGVAQWLGQFGYHYAVAGENLAMGFNTAAEVIDAWTASKTHYANLVDPSYKEVGVGMVAGSYHDANTTLVAQFFGRAAGAKPSAVVAAVVENDQPVAEKLATVASPQVAAVKTTTPTIALPPTTKRTTTAPVVLTSPICSQLTGQKSPVFTVISPISGQVAILDGETVLITGFATAHEPLTLTADLVDGPYQLLARADGATDSDRCVFTIDTTPPMIDQKLTRLVMATSGVVDQETAIEATVVTSADAKQVTAYVNNYTIELSPDPTASNRWTGRAVLFADDATKTLSPVVPGTIVATDQAGNVTTTDIGWDAVVPVEPSAVNQYLFAKQSGSPALATLFSISSWYYRILLLIAVIALGLNIFIQIRRQHPHIIASSVGFIVLMAALLVF